jgi:hypothetical protein
VKFILLLLLLLLLLNSYYPVDQIKKNEMGRACGAYGGEESCMQDFVEKTDGKIPLGRSRCRCTLKKSVGRTWIGLIWHRTETSDGILWTR